MPIYAYKCSSCGHTQDVLQKFSAAPLTDCPACGKATYSKQITAPQFQLKGSGWYVTDFRGGSSGGGKESADGKTEPSKTDTKTETATETKGDSKSNGAKEATPPASAPSTPAAIPAPAKPAAAKE